MRQWLRSHPRLGSAIIGAAVAIFLFVVPGRADLAVTNVVLATLLGATFGGAMFRAMRARPPS